MSDHQERPEGAALPTVGSRPLLPLCLNVRQLAESLSPSGPGRHSGLAGRWPEVPSLRVRARATRAVPTAACHLRLVTIKVDLRPPLPWHTMHITCRLPQQWSGKWAVAGRTGL